MKPPFRILFSNDTTNICTCVSPYHPARELPFTEERLRATVDETVGVGIDVHLQQPGFGEIPWWPSKHEPPQAHTRWLRETYGAERNSYGQYVDGGGDMPKVFLDRCQAVGQAGFISIRLNDAHGKDDVDGIAHTEGVNLGREGEGLSQFYAEHPEWRLSTDMVDWFRRTYDWTVPEVRERRLAFFRELCDYPNLQGLELDFMRFPAFFHLDKTTPEERIAIITAFVAEVRRELDARAPKGVRRWLSARVPAWPQQHHELGLDLARLHAVGLDMAQLSAFFVTRQDADIAAIRQAVPGLALYLEITQTTAIGKVVGGKGQDPYTYRRTTLQQHQTTAHRAYSRGADGLGAFNFVYYREHGAGNRGPFHEPPFATLGTLRDPEYLARQPQHWFIGAYWASRTLPSSPLPRDFAAGDRHVFTMDLVPPAGGWRSGGRLRLQAESDLGTSQWACTVNDFALEPTGDCSELYESPYPNLLGAPSELRAWMVPADCLSDGVNHIAFTLVAGDPAKLVFIDLGVR